MAVLGNKITLMSPSRGFTMELGAFTAQVYAQNSSLTTPFAPGSAITVILASQYGIPVSTTMCITGATLGVSLCNGDSMSFLLSLPSCEANSAAFFSPCDQLARSRMDFPRMDHHCPPRRHSLVSLPLISRNESLLTLVPFRSGCLMAIILYAPRLAA